MNAAPVQSMTFPQEMFGYTAHALMIPPFPTKNVLMLGYGHGTVHRLIETIWGPVNMTGVDIYRPDTDLSDVTFVQKTASEFVHNYKGDPYDFVVIDLFNGNRIPPFVFYDSFASGVRALSLKIIAINCTFYDLRDFRNFGKFFVFDCIKRVNTGQEPGDEDKVMFFRVK